MPHALAFALQTVIVLAAAAAPVVEWQDYEPSDRRFKVKLPAAPKEAHGQWDVYIASDGQTSFGIRVSPVHADKTSLSDAELYDWLQRTETINGRTLVSSRAVTNGGSSGREFTVTGSCQRGPCRLTFRVFRESDTLFILTVWATPDDPATAAATTFLDSFRITRP